MRLTNALVLVLTFVLALFAFFSSYIALHHQQYESNDRNNVHPSGSHMGEGDARHHALQFSRGVGGFNLTKIKAAARDEISYLQAGMKEAVKHVTSGITTSSVNKEHVTKTSTTNAVVPSHKTSPRAVKEAYLSRMANRTELAIRYEKQMNDKQILLEKQRDEELTALRNQVASLKGAVEQERAKARERESSKSTTPTTSTAGGAVTTTHTQTPSSPMRKENNDDPYVVGDQAVTGKKSNDGKSSSSSHSAATTTTGDSLGTDVAMASVSCRRSFEPTCDMYPYVRFWNRQFGPEDCYQSPLRHPNGKLAPLEERKYVIFEPDHGGWNNIRMAAEVAMIFAHATGRILVMPPMMVFYLLNNDRHSEDNKSTFDKFFDIKRLAEAMDVITMDEFIATVANRGLLKIDPPAKACGATFGSLNCEELWKYMGKACYTREWCPGKMFMALNISHPSPSLKKWIKRNSKSKGVFSNLFNFNALNTKQQEMIHNNSSLASRARAGIWSDAHGKYMAEESLWKQIDPLTGSVFGPVANDQHRLRTFASHERIPVRYDAEMHKERAIFFPGDYRDEYRILTHFYTYIYFANPHVDRIYKRIVRDRLHYHDDIFCAAGRVVRLLHQESAKLTFFGTAKEKSEMERYPNKRVVGRDQMPSLEHANIHTLGGDTNKDATYHALHIRRGDFQYKDTRLTAEEIWMNIRHLLDTTVTRLLYIATDERDKNFFRPFQQEFQVRFLSDYTEKAHLGDDHLNQNHIGMVEQTICANAHTFVGTPLSTFTGYITRMRGYYRDNRYARTYYTLKSFQYQLHSHPQIVGPFWAREFAPAHTDIDDR